MTVLTVKEACSYLKIGRNTLYNLMDTGKLKGFKIGKLRRFTQDELEAFVKSQQQSQ
jgi:excisionase family DNA binding protein